MSASVSDILAAVSAGQTLSASGNGFANSQSWKHALERAYTQDEWTMKVTDRMTGNSADLTLELSRRSENVTGPDAKVDSGLRGQSVAQRLAAQAGTGNTADVRPAGSQAFVAPRSDPSGLMPGTTQAATRASPAPGAQLATAGPVRPVPSMYSGAATIGPRSVHLVSSGGQLQVVIRDETLKGTSLTKLVSRIREILSGSGEKLSRIVVNGSEVWSIQTEAVPLSDENDRRTIEILF